MVPLARACGEWVGRLIIPLAILFGGLALGVAALMAAVFFIGRLLSDRFAPVVDDSSNTPEAEPENPLTIVRPEETAHRFQDTALLGLDEDRRDDYQRLDSLDAVQGAYLVTDPKYFLKSGTKWGQALEHHFPHYLALNRNQMLGPTDYLHHLNIALYSDLTNHLANHESYLADISEHKGARYFESAASALIAEYEHFLSIALSFPTEREQMHTTAEKTFAIEFNIPRRRSTA